MTKKTKKLTMRKETLRTLGHASLARVDGRGLTYYATKVQEFFTITCNWEDKDGDSVSGVRG